MRTWVWDMCGIFGTYGFSDKALMQKMDRVIVHRGPDDHGLFIDDDIALGSRRLSIIDLKSGRQPIHNEDRTVWLVYNGETYNFRQLRAELEKKHRFGTASDTEVLVHAYEEYGLDFPSKLNGMFSFALWDTKKKMLILGRDRMGIKPLYYYVEGGRLIFGSEIKSILQHPLKREVDASALYKFLVLKYVPGEATMFRGIRKLPPGHLLICSASGFEVRKYWDVTIKPRDISIDACKEEFRNLMEDSVRGMMISDVPLGAFLSGGLDSSIIVGLMSRLGGKVKTFSVGFDVPEYDELKYARMVSEHFGTESSEMVLDPEKFVKILPRIAWHFDEPNSDPAAIPTLYISELAGKKVKVVLTGEGADELFGGYAKYVSQRRERLSGYYVRMPGGVRGVVKGVLPEKYASYLRAAEKTKRTYLTPNVSYSERLQAHAPRKGLAEEMNAVFDSHVKQHGRLLEMSYIDIKTWLPEEILMKTDKMTMAASIEARVPYLDHNVVNFSFSIPSRLKIQGDVHKRIMREAFRDMLPKEIADRGKWGFNVPLGSWQACLVKDMRDDVLKSEFIRSHVDEAYIRKSMQPKHMQFFYNLIMLKQWHDIFIEQERTSFP